MPVLSISFTGENGALHPVLQGATPALIAAPVECSYLDGNSTRLGYSDVSQTKDGHVAAQSWTHAGYDFSVADSWTPGAEGHLRLERRLRVAPLAGAQTPGAVNGFQLHLALQLTESNGWQFFSPAMLYSPTQRAGERLVTFNDDRLAYPLVAAYRSSTGRAICLSRTSLPAFDRLPERTPGEQRYTQKTDIGSSGFSRGEEGTALHAFWPYYEGEMSALLNARGSDACAFYPLDGSPLEIALDYEIYAFAAESYADAVLTAFKNVYAIAQPETPRLPFSLEQAIEYRSDSLAKTFTEWAGGGAGFILNFDPERGYDSQARAFGASFTTHDTNDSHSILEYGFTGRQLNAAYTLAESRGAQWLEHSARVVDFFVNRLSTPSGWVYTLYHLDKERPLYTVGDPDGPVMHYLAPSDEPGNYTRMMVEAAGDLLLNYRLHLGQGNRRDDWLQACVRFGDFLVGCQGDDGSWYRAYTPEGRPVRSGSWFGGSGAAGKSATGIPVPYLLALAEEAGDRREHYITAAVLACDYVLAYQVALDDYRGGTLDNPNVVDKEAALLAMTALLGLYERTGEEVYLQGAERAAKLAVTWNSIWNVPLLPGTRLAGVGVNSTGWGGINSIWGAGVTDIYSLFYLAEFVRLSRLTGDPIYAGVAELIAHGTQQVMSYPGDLMGFTDVGMQPEGISFCNQGVDDGLIAKGDIWGGLGWIYTAGTFGLNRYLQEKGR